MTTPRTITPNAISGVKVLVIAEDAETRHRLADLLQSDPRIAVLAACADGPVALSNPGNSSADVVLMDLPEAGKESSYQATRQIMQTRPLPIVHCTSGEPSPEVLRCSIEAGAVACIARPTEGTAVQQAQRAAHMRLTMRLMSEIKVVRVWKRTPSCASAGAVASVGADGRQIIGIGASTGGPPALQTILAGLPANLRVPVLVVQHIAPGFLPGLAHWLCQTSGLPVQIAAQGMRVLPGQVYLAPDDHQMGIDHAGRIAVTRVDDDNGLRPSVAYLFRSLAEVYGARTVAVLLSGMGKDGAAELQGLHALGAVTIAQDLETSVVHGMPGEAIALGGASKVLPIHRIACTLVSLVQPGPLPKGN